MSFYRIIFVLLITIPCFGQKHFVEVNKNEIKIERAGNLTRVMIPFNVEDGYYIQDFTDVVGNVLPTEFSVDTNSGFEKIEQELATQDFDYVKFDKLTHRVLKERFVVEVILRLKENSKYPEHFTSTLFYQTCNTVKCFFPRELNFDIELGKYEE